MGIRLHAGGKTSIRLDTGGSTAIHVDAGGMPSPEYKGAYVATPTHDMQTFPTEGKRMARDFTVNSIVKQEAPNEAGGLTLSI